MKTSRYAPLIGAFAIALTALLAACGGGGGGTGGGGSVGGSGGVVTPPTNPPTATPTWQANGTVSVGGQALANASVVFTCGCSAQAGIVTSDASGNYTISPSTSAIPASPNPTYTTVPGRNYMVIGFSPSTSTETWTMVFLGNTPPTNLALGGSSNGTDVASTAASLYIYRESQNNSDESFDDWNFNAISGWAAHLRANSGLTPNEQKFLADIASAQTKGTSLFPSVPVYIPNSTYGTPNAQIATDINNIKADGTLDPTLPTPCPSGVGSCTGTPSP